MAYFSSLVCQGNCQLTRATASLADGTFRISQSHKIDQRFQCQQQLLLLLCQFFTTTTNLPNPILVTGRSVRASHIYFTMEGYSRRVSGFCNNALSSIIKRFEFRNRQNLATTLVQHTRKAFEFSTDFSDGIFVHENIMRSFPPTCTNYFFDRPLQQIPRRTALTNRIQGTLERVKFCKKGSRNHA